MYCPKCGKPIDNDTGFCDNCTSKTGKSPNSNKALNFLGKLPSAFFAWLTALAIFSMVTNQVQLSMDGFLADVLCLVLVLVCPVVVSVLLHRKSYPQKPIYQKWWFWLICAIVVLVTVGKRTDALSPDATDPIQTTDPTEITEATDPTIPEPTELTEPTKNTEPTEATEATEPKETTPPTEAVKTNRDQFVADFCQTSGCQPETAERIYDLLHDGMLFEDITFTGKNAVAQINWDVSADDYILMVTADDEGIYRIICGSFVLFEDSEAKLTKTDMEARSITGYESLYYVIAQEIVESNLTSPTSANFAPMYECAMQRNGDLVAVQGYVDAQNAFGVAIRSDFIVEFRLIDAATFTYEVLYIEIGGQTAGEFIPLD